LGLEREDTIACGDGLNDLTMIKYAGIGVAMGNAQQEVKDAADAGAVETLLILDSKLREEDLDTIVRTVEVQKGNVIIVSAQHDGGKQLASLGGLGAILRYRLA
ncbi:MAG: HAD hydrolase family protein, partial [Candidatus Methanomethylophilaceae archaeon]|nr:HAD hydrolase family protein [Candidatus Methanomethylophilaceae archaeon]